MSGIKYRRTYIEVGVNFKPDGTFLPEYILWRRKRYDIEKVAYVKPVAAWKGEGKALCYTCIINGKERRLFLENGQRWYVEER